MSLIHRFLAFLLKLLYALTQKPRPSPPTLSSPTWSTDMSKVTIPVSAPTTRVDGTPLAPSEISKIDAAVSLDGGATFTPVPITGGQIVIDGLDPGVSGVVHATATDTQNPPRTSDFAVQMFSIPAPALAQPSPPTLGAPVIS